MEEFIMNVADITITSLETITAFDLTGAYRFTLDELQNAKIENTQEKTDITGKQGRKLGSIKKNKAVTISGTNGMISGGLLEAQTGNKFKTGETTVMFPDYLVVSENGATTTYKAVGTTGNEIDSIYVKNTNGSLGKELKQDATVSTGKFTYNPTSKAIKFNEGELTDGTEIVVYYKRKINASVLDNISDNYSEKLTLYIDAFGEDKCNNIYRIQFYIPKADFNGDFDFEMGDDQSVHSFEAESLAGGACGNKTSGSLWTYTVFGTDEPDAA